LNILQIIPVFSDVFGGPVTVVRSMSKELAKKNNVVVYTTTAIDLKHDHTPMIKEIDGYRIEYYPRNLKFLSNTNFLGHLNISFQMMNAIKKNVKKFDVVHIHSYQQFPDIVASRYAKINNIPFVLQTHGSIPKIEKHIRKFLFDVLFAPKILFNSSKIIALNQSEYDQCINLGVPKNKIVIIPNSLDISLYNNLPRKNSFKIKYNINLHKKIVLYLGRIHKSKGLDLLIKAYLYLIKNIGDKKSLLVIVGPDDGFFTELKAIVNKLGLTDSVLFTGFISNKEKIKALVDADVFVTPIFYGFPITFLEACCTGTPIITTFLGDKLDWIDGNVGYVVKPRPKEIAQAIQKIFSDENLHEELSKNCRDKIIHFFSSDKVTNSIEQLYKEILSI